MALAGSLLFGVRALASPGGEALYWENVAASSGLVFQHVNGSSGRFFTVETYGSGGAFFDYDGGGDADLYLVNGADLPSASPSRPPPVNRLFRNEGGDFFFDVTAATGAGDGGYGMGVAVGDVDNDGLCDFYVTNWGANALYRNTGAKFLNVTAGAGVGDPHMGTSAAFGDYDLDGQLDLYVANYAHIDLSAEKRCFQGGVRVYCGPLDHEGISGVLYRNRGDGTFEDRTLAMGVFTEKGRQLGVLFADYDQDGDPDLYIANDAVANFLFRNDSTAFVETALLAGVAYSDNGEPEAGMGTNFGDYDNDGDPDLIVTNYQWESSRLYRNEGDFFSDATTPAGMTAATLPFLGFGVNFLDIDNDGLRDLYMVNGHVDSNVRDYDHGASYAQRSLLFHNEGDGRFTEVGLHAGPGMTLEMVGRGSATADYDLDGDVDLCAVSNGGPAVLLRNDSRNTSNWLQVKAVGTQSNRSAIGARLVLRTGTGIQSAEVRSGSGYLSQSELPVHFGLGATTQVDRLTIYWPSGKQQVLEDIPANQRLTVIEPERK